MSCLEWTSDLFAAMKNSFACQRTKESKKIIKYLKAKAIIITSGCTTYTNFDFFKNILIIMRISIIKLTPEVLLSQFTMLHLPYHMQSVYFTCKASFYIIDACQNSGPD